VFAHSPIKTERTLQKSGRWRGTGST